jgi:hypothetical protein
MSCRFVPRYRTRGSFAFGMPAWDELKNGSIPFVVRRMCLEVLSVTVLPLTQKSRRLAVQDAAESV